MITEQNGQIVATISITADNSLGLPIDNYFKEKLMPSSKFQ